MVSRDFIRQIEGYGLTTAKILYRMPDHPNLSRPISGRNTISPRDSPC